MCLLIPEITTLLSALASAGLFTTAVIWICKIVIAYIQRDKDKRIQMKKTEKGEIDVTFTGYSRKDVREITKGDSLKKIIVESNKKPIQLVKPGNRSNHR